MKNSNGKQQHHPPPTLTPQSLRDDILDWQGSPSLISPFSLFHWCFFFFLNYYISPIFRYLFIIIFLKVTVELVFPDSQNKGSFIYISERKYGCGSRRNYYKIIKK